MKKMEITKKELITLISESEDEVKEMSSYKTAGNQAWRHEIDPITGEYKIDPETGQEIKKIYKNKPYWREGNNTNVPDYYTLNPQAIRDADEIVIPCDCQETENFINNNTDWLNEIMDKHGKEHVNFIGCKVGEKPRGSNYPLVKYYKSGDVERDLKFSAKQTTPGGVSSLSKNITDRFNQICYKFIGSSSQMGQKLNNELNIRSIPGIFMDPKTDYKTQRHYNPYTMTDRTNEKIEHTTVSFNGYTSAEQFLNCVLARIDQDQEEIKWNDCEDTFHMSNQFAPIIKWSKDRLGTKAFLGKTKYDKFKEGYRPKDYNILIRSVLNIKGEKLNENEFKWEITLSTDFGQKAPTEYNMQGKMYQVTWGDFHNNKPIVITKVAKLDPEKQFTEQRGNTIMDDEAVVASLIEAFDELHRNVESIDPTSVVDVVRISEKDVKS